MKRWIAILLVLVFVGAGCKSSTTLDVASNADDGAAPTTAPDDSDNSGDDEPGDDSSGSNEGSDDSSDDDTDDSNDDAGDMFANGDDWCTVARAVESRFDELDVVGFSDPVALEKAYTEALEIVRAAEFIAPDAIAADVTTTVRGLEAFVEALEAVGWSFLDLDLTILDDLAGELEVASFNIERYNFEECGIDNGFDPADDPALNPDSDELDFSTDGTLRDQVIESFIQSGFTPAEAACLAESLDITNPDALADASSLFSVFAECGISIDRLGQLGG